jgi:RNA polymerase sigma factor (sigma-70 family)
VIILENSMSRLENLQRKDAVDPPNQVTPLNIEIACAFALRMSRKWKRNMPKEADHLLFDEAAINAVMSAAEKYKPDNPKKATFFTYSYSKVIGALKEEDRKYRRRPTEVSFDDVAQASRKVRDGGVDYDPIRIEETFSCKPVEVAEEMQKKAFIRDLFVRVCPLALGTDEKGIRATEILLLRFVRGVRQKDVAPLFGVTPGRIHQIEDESISKIRTYIAKESRES